MIHYLKTDPIPFGMSRKGTKPFEIRFNDRDYKVGDILVQRYFVRKLGLYKFDALVAKVLSVFKEKGYGIEDGYCVLGLRQSIDLSIEYVCHSGGHRAIANNYSLIGKQCIVRLNDYRHIYTIDSVSEKKGEIIVNDPDGYRVSIPSKWLYVKDESQLFTVNQDFCEGY